MFFLVSANTYLEIVADEIDETDCLSSLSLSDAK